MKRDRDLRDLVKLYSDEMKPVPTGGKKLPDGSVLEVVRNDVTSKVELLHWEDGESAISAEFFCGGKRYVPSHEAVHLKWLPSGASSYLSTRDLFEELQAFIVLGLNASSESATQLAHFCLASFFGDVIALF